MAAKQRETTAEGIERDLAISYLSRYALLRTLAPRLKTGARVFVMGFPGAGNLGAPNDLNAEHQYEAFAAHTNTVAGNEALVLHGAKAWPHLSVFGLNPGLVKTNIRANYLGESSLTHRLAETLIGLLTPSAGQYAERTLPVLFAAELEGQTGRHFNKKAKPILPTEGFAPAHVEAFIAASDALLARANVR